MKVFLGLILGLILLSQSAIAGKMTCSSIFIQDQIETLNRDSKDFIQSRFNPQLQKNPIHRYLLNKALQKVSIERMSQQKDFDFAIQVLYRRLLKLSGKNKSQLPADIWVEQTLFTEGLKPFLKDYQSLVSDPRFSTKLVQFFSHRAVQFLINPGQLPSVKDAPIPPELLAKIYLTGVKNNQSALMKAYQSSGQNRADFYRKIQNAYQKVFLAVTIVLLIQTYQDTQDEISELNKEAYMDSFDDLEAGLLELDQLLEEKGLYQ